MAANPSGEVMGTADTNPDYWVEYCNLQHVKHALIREYLKGWFPKMALGPGGSSRLLYVDTHAGRGKHLNGELGSPLVALTTLLNHQSRVSILKNTEVRFFFIERNETNVSALREELAVRSLPEGVFAQAEQGDSFEIIEDLFATFERDGKQLAPGFFFVDPYGFKLPGNLLRKLLGYPRVELFVNVIWRELDMAIMQSRGNDGSSLAQTLNSVFAGDGWKNISANDSDARAEQCADLFREITGARWGTHIRMLDNGRIRYFLLHLTKHDAGRDLMKECMWKACPDGGFYASRSNNPRQQLLIQPEPNLAPLHDWVKQKLAAAPKHWQDLSEAVREELWLPKQLNEVIQELRRQHEVEATGFSGRFAPTNNPLLHLRVLPKTRELF